jgi:membrane protease YdiL (CAAX protease family)|tara:strand:- start:40 stop:441 length:402 start_codon:yes stop_codon:yes gene_type:complete
MANITVVVIYMIIATYFGVKFLYTPEIPKDILGFGWFIFPNLFAICIWVPVIEELFFRGFLLRLFMRRWGTFSAVVTSSLVFAVLHGHIGLLIPLFICSIVISLLYIRSGSIYPSILAHAGGNLSVSLVAASA